MKRKVLVELFTEGCPACAGWFGYGHELTSSSQEYELRVWDPREEHDAAEREKRLTVYGIKQLPAIAIDGELLACCE